MDEKDKYQNFITEIPSTAVDIYRMLPEGTRCEVIFNELSMSPSPSREHQKVLIKLTAILFEFLNQHPVGELFSAPFDVYFEAQQSVVQPDLFVVLNADQDTIKKNGVHGVPSLIIEIVSTNRSYDTQKKRALYETVGVKEYFIIDPENKKTTLLTLSPTGIYEQTYEEAGVLNSAVLSCSLTF
jgi:Uma2 family endonuclease